MKRIVSEMQTARISELMAPFRNDAVGFCVALGLQMNDHQAMVMRSVQQVADGGTRGLVSDELTERALMLATFWWAFRQPSSMAIVTTPSDMLTVRWLAFIHAAAFKISPKIAEHVTFSNNMRMRIGGHAAWGLLFLTSDGRTHVQHDAPHLAVIEISANRLKAPPMPPARQDIMRISTWEAPPNGAARPGT